ncbi:D-2-hydroxyacid dehydrogenase [Halobacteria archaeon AArc-m2/3/4]|uniref:D-2-hydroxyacid dehydrogenase n=1 Tax=Natronoglomus mannanivorans TaxID=2979990 RepID=A0ABT2QCC3_9EURY|nr:D-2-hydroxyacid dehydrogenase [Halobacteria archaeon AArc-m2/3/4]
MADHDHEILVPHTYSAETKSTLESELADLEGATLTIAETADETLSGFETATVAITPRLPEEWLERATDLEWAQATSAGVDHYDLDALSERGIVLTNATGVHAQPIAEQVLGAMLSFEREFLRARDQQREGVWLRTEGGELASKTVGVVGLGAIGGRVAELASAIGSRVVGTKRDPSSAPDTADAVYPPDELDEVLRRADYLVLACPLTEETRGLIDGAALETMPDEAVLVNIARGEVADQEALVEGLQQGRIAGAALDVFAEEPLPEESPLWNLPNVLLTPHMAGSTPHYYERIGDIFRENFECFADGDLEGMRNRIV